MRLPCRPRRGTRACGFRETGSVARHLRVHSSKLRRRLRTPLRQRECCGGVRGREGLTMGKRRPAAGPERRGVRCSGPAKARRWNGGESQESGAGAGGARLGGSGRRPTLPRRCRRSTIGAGELNCRVRDGNGCGLPAGATREGPGPLGPGLRAKVKQSLCSAAGALRPGASFTGKPVGRLVTVSCARRRACTPVLSNSSSASALVGKPGLGRGFALRCFQRFSPLDFATQRCHWRDSWLTSGPAASVLSYWRQLPSSFLRPPRIRTELSRDVLNPARVPL